MPKRSCLFFGHNGRGQLGWKPSESLKGRRQEGRVNAIREEPGYIYIQPRARDTSKRKTIETVDSEKQKRIQKFTAQKFDTMVSADTVKMAHSLFFLPQDRSSQMGKVLDRTRYPTGQKGFSVKLIGLMLPIQTFAFPFTWFQTASCLQLLPKCPNGWDEELATQGG